ncbi:MAG TPA: aldose 1-epimerase family protein [Micromonosporaceae bacterium]|jgi:aldose 1-epimerase
MPYAPSGRQFELRLASRVADQTATIVEVGGGIRAYRVGDRDVLHPYPIDAMCDGAHGAPLIPWPNRLGDGRYRFDGVDYQVSLTEPEKRNALHGFLRWRTWEPMTRTDSRIVLGTRHYPQQGYPFALDVRIEYALSDGGLTVATTATNIGDAACPYACGQHPYLSPGSGLVDDGVLELSAGTRIVTDPQRQLPTGTEAVSGSAYDFRTARRIGDQPIDFAFDDLDRDADGLAWVNLTGADGRTARLWVDASYPLVEIYTADTLAPDRRRCGLGVEPMTCPPNGLQSGDRVIRLEPGDTVTTRWGATLA